MSQVVINYRIDANAPGGSYTLVDYIPAGLRFVSIEPQDTMMSRFTRAWLLSEDANRLSFGLYKDASLGTLMGELRINVRVATPGEYLAEEATLSHAILSGMGAKSEATRLSIR